MKINLALKENVHSLSQDPFLPGDAREAPVTPLPNRVVSQSLLGPRAYYHPSSEPNGPILRHTLWRNEYTSDSETSERGGYRAIDHQHVTESTKLASVENKEWKPS